MGYLIESDSPESKLLDELAALLPPLAQGQRWRIMRADTFDSGMGDPRQYAVTIHHHETDSYSFPFSDERESRFCSRREFMTGLRMTIAALKRVTTVAVAEPFSPKPSPEFLAEASALLAEHTAPFLRVALANMSPARLRDYYRTFILGGGIIAQVADDTAFGQRMIEDLMACEAFLTSTTAVNLIRKGVGQDELKF